MLDLVFFDRLCRLGCLYDRYFDVPSGTDKEMNRRKDMVTNLRSKSNQMASAFNISNFANRYSVLGPETKPDTMSRTISLDNSGLIVSLRAEQDEGLEKLEETLVSTKHIALAVSEELGLHTTLTDDLGQHVDVTDSHLQRVQKNLGIMNKPINGGWSCMCMLLAVNIGIVVLLVLIYLLIKYL
ncbi:hypothetical protein GOBAR_DD35369 [Gossypium barbadense]|nr:hypothetical protein GOBAR_DD35369 [Gossypium barbadense]